MGSFTVLGLGQRVMRSLSLGGKLALVALLSALPLLLVLWQMALGDGPTPGLGVGSARCAMALLLGCYLIAVY